MFEPNAEAFASATRVPAWVRPSERHFTERPSGAPGGFSAWADPAEPIAAEEPPVPIAEAETLIAQGFAEGLAAGRAQMEAELAQERAALAGLAEALTVLQPEAPAPLAALLSTTVRRLVAQIMGEVAIDGALLEERVIALAQHIADETGPSRLRMHPADAARLGGAVLPIAPTPDASLAPGAIVLETASGWIEDGPAVRLEKLNALLDRLGAPR